MSGAARFLATLDGSQQWGDSLDLGDSSAWTDVERAVVVARLTDAAKAGDPRTPGALATLLPDSQLEVVCSELLLASAWSVRLAAGEVLRSVWQRKLANVFAPIFAGGLVDDNALHRGARLLLSIGAEPEVRSFVTGTSSELARTQLLKALWVHHHFDRVPMVWWRGLGLLRWRLDLPLPSFRTEAITRFFSLCDGNPAALAAESESAAVPVALQACVEDARNGTGPLQEAAIRALPAELSAALLVYAATKALDLQSVRCLEIVALVGGAKHRDLLELAARSPHAEFSAAAVALMTRN